ncbi:type II secretion system F family protein [uncultured Senegalimassilia sp.]|uniref:type II secretion system F family protein n=1 Tax=uncultured Senegalimassilia sp. TaxID=1714350 RepID=UPI0025F5E7B9|nr:type II secretion system F family protein [uncultured Senegalimassilia sp.]
MQGLTLCAICLLAVAAGLAVYEALNAWAGVKERRHMPAWVKPEQEGGGASRHLAREGMARLRERAVTALAGFAPLSMRERERSRERLRVAGIALEPETWRCACFAAVSGCVLVAVAACAALHVTPVAFVFAVGGAGFAGCGGLQLYLRSKRQARRAAIDAGLPDAMELLGVAIAAGSPVEHCFRQVAESLNGPLADEFRLVDQEVNLLGHSRAKALSNLAQRCASQEVTAFAAQLTQAIEQGASVAQGLANQAALARSRAQAAALEHIRKMPTKLDVVLSVCFLPPTTLLVLVPTVVDLLAFLGGGLA